MKLIIEMTLPNDDEEQEEMIEDALMQASDCIDEGLMNLEVGEIIDLNGDITNNEGDVLGTWKIQADD